MRFDVSPNRHANRVLKEREAGMLGGGRFAALQASEQVRLGALGTLRVFRLSGLDGDGRAEAGEAPGLYPRWLARMERRLLELGILTREELDDRIRFYRRHPDAEVPRREDPAAAGQVMERMRNRLPPPRDSGRPPRFRVGEAVRTRNDHPGGHHRLPRYARGRRGTIARHHGYHDLADDMARGVRNSEALYCVRFDAAELWGESAEGRGSVYIDLWDSYLEPARAQEVSDE